MKSSALLAKSLLGLAFLVSVMATCVFAPAGTGDFWQRWVFLAVFNVTVGFAPPPS